MDAIKILEDQHREVEDLFEEFEEADDPSTKMQAVEAIANALAAHAAIEEKIFYPGVKTSDTEEILRESLEEHLGVKRFLDDLLRMSPEDEQFEAKVTAVKEQVEHHVEEEEKALFPKVRKNLGKKELEAMGAQMENLYAELMAEGDPKDKIPEETDQAPPLHG